MGKERRHILRDLRYETLPSQQRFHESDARFKGFSGPVGSGKSAALCHETLFLAYLNAGRTGLLGAPTFPMLKDATQAGFLQMLQTMGVPYELNKAEQVLTLTEPRSKILFRAVEEFDRLRGTNLAWFGVDELTYAPEEAWLRLEARLRDPKAARLCGFAVWTPKGRDWVWRKFIENKTAGYEAIRAKAYENKFLLEKTPDFYERLKASYDEQFFAQEVLGDYVHQTDGLVYFAFDRTLHVQEAKFDPHRPLLWALDFNVNPMSSVIAQRYGDTIAVLDEIVLRQATTDQAAEEFLTRYPSHGPGVVIYGDSAGNNQHTTGGTDYDIVRRRLSSAGVSAQYRIPKGNPLIHARTNLVNSMFRNAEKRSRLTISPKCRELVRDFEEVLYKPGSTVIDKERDSKRTHLSDALGYLLWKEFQPRVIAGERSEPLNF